MCYYDQVRFTCGCYKWSTYRAQCAKEYRTGESCGLKLCFNTINDEKQCKICQKIATKYNRIDKAAANIRRWQREGNRTASIEKAEDEIEDLEEEIRKLKEERERKRNTL